MPFPKEQNVAGPQSPAPRQQRSPRPAPRPQPAPYNPPPPVVSNSGGQYSGGGGAPRPTPNANRQGNVGGVGRQDAIQRRQGGGGNKKPAPKPQPKIPGMKDFIAGDETYQSSISTLMKELEDYKLSNKGQRGDIREDFGLSQTRMADERMKALEDMQNDFAARGLLNSSEFLDAQGEYETQYNQRIGDLSRDRDRNLEDLLESLGMYKRTNKNERQNARAEAVRRRAEQYGITG